MKKRIAELINVKTIVTLLVTIVFCVLALCGTISGTDFLEVFMVIIIFYFGTQAGKRDAAATYTGPQQSGETVQQTSERVVNSVDAAHVQKTHPPSFGPIAE